MRFALSPEVICHLSAVVFVVVVVIGHHFGIFDIILKYNNTHIKIRWYSSDPSPSLRVPSGSVRLPSRPTNRLIGSSSSVVHPGEPLVCPPWRIAHRILRVVLSPKGSKGWTLTSCDRGWHPYLGISFFCPLTPRGNAVGLGLRVGPTANRTKNGIFTFLYTHTHTHPPSHP